jgi:hypothetical protein
MQVPFRKERQAVQSVKRGTLSSLKLVQFAEFLDLAGRLFL